jgi:hypothetical protein
MEPRLPAIFSSLDEKSAVSTALFLIADGRRARKRQAAVVIELKPRKCQCALLLYGLQGRRIKPERL